MNDKTETTTIPIVEERAVIGKREEHSRVRVKTRVAETRKWVEEELRRENVVIERVPVEAYADTVPEVRQEGDRLIVPIVEEVLVVEKRLFVTEELHIIKQVSYDTAREELTLLKTEAQVERSDERSDT